MPEPMLNPMHPPLAKQIIAFSIHTFGDNPLGWRYPAALFGALAIVAVYLCGLALFAAQGPAIAAALIAFFNQMLFVEARTAMLDIFALTFGLFGTAAFLYGFRKAQPFGAFALSGLAFGLAAALQMERIVSARRLHRHRRRGQADAKLAHAICRSLPDRLVPAGSLARLQGVSSRDLLRAGAGVHLCRELRAALRLLAADLIEAQRRIFSDNTTTAIAGHTYMSSWPSWPLLMRPVWFLFDKIGDDRISAVVLLGNPLVLWPALLAIALCLYDWIAARSRDAFLILAFYFGPWLAWALLPRTLGFLYYYMPAATFASLALVYALRRNNAPPWLLWGFVAIAACGFAVMLPISAAFIGTSMANFNRLMLFQSWI